MSKIETAKAVKVGVKRLDWILKLAAELEAIGSMENAEQDAQKKLDETYEALELANADIAAANETLRMQGDKYAAIKKQGDEAYLSAQERSEDEIGALQTVLLDMTVAANENAASIVDGAQKEADAIKLDSEGASKAVSDAREELMAIKAEYEGVKQGIASAKAAAKAAMQEFAG